MKDDVNAFEGSANAVWIANVSRKYFDVVFLNW